MKKIAGAFFVAALLLSAAGLALVSLVTSNFVAYLPYITVNSDGIVEPETGLIARTGDTYVLTADLSQEYAVRIQCSNIVFDGAGHVINGTVSSGGVGYANNGLSLVDVANVTVKNLEVTGFMDNDVSLEKCYNCTIFEVKTNDFRIANSTSNVITENSIIGICPGLLIRFSYSNKFHRNNINSLDIGASDYNIFSENNFGYPSNGENSIRIGGSNLWDNGSVGNYWNDYFTKYHSASEIGSSGIGDTAYVIDADNVDRYPLMVLVDNIVPAIEVLWPASGTYNASSIQLSFTVDEPASLIAYSLDGEENVTITGNVTLAGLANGVHDLTIYARDKAGNTGASETIYFDIDVPEPFPAALVSTASVALVAVVGMGVVVYRKRQRRQNP